MDENRLFYLIDQVSKGLATPEELAEYDSRMNWLSNPPEAWNIQQLGDESQGREASWTAIAQRLEPVPVRRLVSWPRVAAAACILFVLSAGSYFLLHKMTVAPQQTAQVTKPDLLPGSQSAILQLSNGQQIDLTHVKAGQIAKQGQTNITKTTDNKIVYEAGKANEELAYNTITTKRGNFYPLTLSDGTVAILDAASSIKYPVMFTGDERKVEITGQVYFEVKHNSKMPFRVIVKGQTIEDLGTSFNINAYDDEPNIKTTLIEGSIRVNDQRTIAPGQQAIIANGVIKVEQADTEQAIAWKNGKFNFDGVKIADAMRQLSRWYDVDIEYPEGLPKGAFKGGISRNMNASQVLEALSFFKVHFEITQTAGRKKIVVKP